MTLDLRPYFKYLHWRVMHYSNGVQIASDWIDKPENHPLFGPWKRCGFWTIEEANLLCQIASMVGGRWLDIGSHTGWTTAHIFAAGCAVTGIDPLYHEPEIKQRAIDNLAEVNCYYRNTSSRTVSFWAGTSDEWFSQTTEQFDGIVIDGDHEPPQPLHDAQNAHKAIKDNGVIIFHDLIYPGPTDAYDHLLTLGWSGKKYQTTHAVAICYRSSFIPPEK